MEMKNIISPMKNIISPVLIINGIYDIICAFSILFLKQNEQNIFGKIHKNMYFSSEKIISDRFLAYWILTNGLIRFFSGIFPKLYFAAAITYFTEVFIFMNETTIEKMKFANVLFVVATSFFIGVLCVLWA